MLFYGSVVGGGAEGDDAGEHKLRDAGFLLSRHLHPFGIILFRICTYCTNRLDTMCWFRCSSSCYLYPVSRILNYCTIQFVHVERRHCYEYTNDLNRNTLHQTLTML